MRDVGEDDDAVLALRLRGHHRRLGAGDELARVHRVLGPEGDAGRECDLADGLGRALQQRILDPRGEPERIRGGARRQDHGKLLAADATDRVGRAGDALQHLGEELEHVVALAVAADIVDALEVVDVEHQQRDGVVRAAGAVELRAQALMEVAVVVEAGQRVCVREVLEACADLCVVERQRGGVAEPARKLEVVLVELRVLADAVDVQCALQLAAGDQRDCDQRLRVGRRPGHELDARIEMRVVREHGAAVCDRPAGDPLAELDPLAEDLLGPGAAREDRDELAALLVRLVDMQILVRHEVRERVRDAVEQHLVALLGEHVVEHRGQPAVRIDERLGSRTRLGRRVGYQCSVSGHLGSVIGSGARMDKPLPGDQRKRSSSGGMTSSCAELSPAASTPRTIATGTRSVFPIANSAAAAISSASAITVEWQLVAGRIVLTTQVAEHLDPGGADRHVRDPAPPGAAERVRDDDAEPAAGTALELVAEPRGGGVGILGEQHDGLRLGRVRRVDAGGCADEAVPSLRDHERRPRAEDARRFAEDDLETAGIALRPGELDRLRGRLDLVEADDLPLGLRDHLVRDADDVAVLELGSPRDQRGEVIVHLDLRQPFHREDLDDAFGVTTAPRIRLPAMPASSFSASSLIRASPRLGPPRARPRRAGVRRGGRSSACG